MRRLVIAPAAEADVESILGWTEEHFGELARRRYEALLVRAILDVAERPDRAGVNDRPELAASARTYHLFHSRQRVTAGVGRVKEPRHFLLFRERPDGKVEIGRVLHDSMDLAKHLPEEYRKLGGGR
jgi:toxin ParE1/3/4